MPYALAFPKHPDSRAAGRARSCPGRHRVARAYGVPLQ